MFALVLDANELSPGRERLPAEEDEVWAREGKEESAEAGRWGIKRSS